MPFEKSTTPMYGVANVVVGYSAFNRRPGRSLSVLYDMPFLVLSDCTAAAAEVRRDGAAASKAAPGSPSSGSSVGGLAKTGRRCCRCGLDPHLALHRPILLLEVSSWLAVHYRARVRGTASGFKILTALPFFSSNILLFQQDLLCIQVKKMRLNFPLRLLCKRARRGTHSPPNL